MASTFKYAVFGGSALVLVTLGLTLRHGGTGESKSPGPASSGASTTVETAPVKAMRRVAAVRQWPVGSAFVYEVNATRTLSRLRDGAPQTGDAATIAGELAVAVVEVGPDAVRLRLELRNARHQDAQDPGLPDAELARAFYADAERDGHLKGFAFQTDISSGVRAELKLLAEALQLVDSPLAETWKSTELDVTGEYAATYQRSGDTIRKTKDRYVRALGLQGLQPLRDPGMLRVKSQADFTLAPSAWPASATIDEVLEAKAGAFHLMAHRQMKAVLARVEQVRDLAALAAADGSLVPDAPDAAGFADLQRRQDEGRVAGASFRTILGELRSDDVHVQNNAIGRAAALFRLHPEDTDKAAKTVLKGDLDEDAKQRLLGALGSAETKEGQAALASVLAAPSASAETRAAAAAVLGMSEEPTQESEDAIISAMASPDTDVANTATLGAGNLIKRMNIGGGDVSTAVEALLAKLAAATTDDERHICLQGLGNTGDPQALGAIEKYLIYEVRMVREAAVFALRFITDESVDRDLTIAMKDEDAIIRRAAVSTLQFRVVTPILATVGGLLRTDPDETLRLGIVAALRARRAEEPSVIDLLQWAASHDPSEEVQKAAKSALEES